MSLVESPNINVLWASLLIEELSRAGITQFCLSPGSRSAPLATALFLNKKTKTSVHYDERGLAFFALGIVAATKKPCVIISTSGTAAANFFPAIIEASKKKLPLIVLTADRPPELRKTGANQTIDQPGIYGEYVRFQFDMPCPTTDIPAAFVLTTVGQAVYRAIGNLPGPVHLNCMFREPLTPQKTAQSFVPYLKPLQKWLASHNPYTQYVSYEKNLNENTQKQILMQLEKIRNGIIVVGKLKSVGERKAVLRLAAQLNWPVFPDISSGLRIGNNEAQVIAYFDQLLLADNFTKGKRVDGVLHLGGRITSKRWNDFIEQNPPDQYLMVLNHPLRNDPSHQVSMRIESSIKNFCDAFIPQLKVRLPSSLLQALQRYSPRIEKEIDRFFLSKSKISEPGVSRLISQLIPQDTGLFLASSLPIREIDMFADGRGAPVIIESNRGASGIDGTIATAAGFANGLNKTTTLLIGDLAFLHDINSLHMLKERESPFVIVLFNNDGGGIFSLLPIAEHKELFEKYFGTPHGLTFSKAAQLFDLEYTQPKTLTAFKAAYRKALKQKKATLIEVITDREQNAALQLTWKRKISSILNKL